MIFLTLSIIPPVEFQVIDTNDRPTGISFTSQGVYENATAGTFVGTLQAQDEDANQTHSFVVISGLGKFEMYWLYQLILLVITEGYFAKRVQNGPSCNSGYL